MAGPGKRADNAPPVIRPWLIVLITIPCLLLAGAAVAVLLFIKPLIKERVIDEARKRGVTLQMEDVDVWFGSVTLEGVRFELKGVDGFVGEAERIDVLLDALQPTRATAEDVAVALTGPLPELLLDAEEWTRRYRPVGAGSFPVSATDVAVTWRAGEGVAPWFSLAGGQVSHGGGRTTLSAERANVVGAEVHDIGASLNDTDAQLSVALGSTEPEAATVTVNVNRTVSPPRAILELAPTPLAHLAAPLALPIPTQGVQTTARADLVLPERPPGPVRGHMDAALEGFTPPHPVELDGFDFGRRTTFSTDLLMNADASRVDLTETVVRAGDFSLRGDGEIVRQGGAALVRMTLRGNLSCKTIARSAARARVGSVLGKVLGDAAHRILDGFVGVTVEIRANSQDPSASSVKPKIGIGCGLAPMTLSELADLGLDSIGELAKGMGMPEDLVDGARARLPSVPSGLPPAPSGLPSAPRGLPTLPSGFPRIPSALPELPKLPFELKRKEKDEDKKVSDDTKVDERAAPQVPGE